MRGSGEEDVKEVGWRGWSGGSIEPRGSDDDEVHECIITGI